MAQLRKQWFLVGLVCVLLVGGSQHSLLQPVVDQIPRRWLVAAIMLAMSCPLDLGRALRCSSALSAVGIAVVTNSVLAGPLAWLVGFALPAPLAVGLVVVGMAPCTLATAAVWTRKGNGNEAAALAVTVVTNLASFLVIPAGLALLLGNDPRAQAFDTVALGERLLMIVVLPIAVGQLLRVRWGLGKRFDANRHRFSLVAQLGLLCMILIGAVRNGELLATPGEQIGSTDWVMLLFAVLAVHLLLFAIAWHLAIGLRLKRGDALAAGIAGSQKTLAVGLDVALSFGGLAILPMLVYHATQLVVDAALVEKLKVKQAEESKPAGQTA